MACCKTKIGTSVPAKGDHQTKIVLGYAGSYKNICAKDSSQAVQAVPITSQISVDKTAYLETQRDTSSKKYVWDMREAMKTYARSPVHSLCALCPSPPKDQLTKTANLETQRGKSSQKHPGDMPKAIKTYARRPVDSLCKVSWML